MEKEIGELTKQRDLAQSRVEDLLQLMGNDKSPITEKVCAIGKVLCTYTNHNHQLHLVMQ